MLEVIITVVVVAMGVIVVFLVVTSALIAHNPLLKGYSVEENRDSKFYEEEDLPIQEMLHTLVYVHHQ